MMVDFSDIVAGETANDFDRAVKLAPVKKNPNNNILIRYKMPIR